MLRPLAVGAHTPEKERHEKDQGFLHLFILDRDGRARIYQSARAPIGICSMSRTPPVRIALSSEAKYAAASAISRGVSSRPNGINATASPSQSARLPSLLCTTSSPSVSVQPTLSWLTRIR